MLRGRTAVAGQIESVVSYTEGTKAPHRGRAPPFQRRLDGAPKYADALDDDAADLGGDCLKGELGLYACGTPALWFLKRR